MSSFFDEASLVFIPSGYKTSKAYSVKPTSGDGDLAFTRSNDTASRVASNGLIERVRTNNLLYTEAGTNAAWFKDVGVTVTDGQQDANGGTKGIRIQYSGFDKEFRQAIAGLSGPFTMSVYIKGTASETINLYDGVTNSNKTLNGSWQRFTVTSTQSGSVSFSVNTYGASARDILISFPQFEAGDIATDYIATTSAAVSVGPVANVPRLDYLNSSCPRLLLEPQRTNLATYSEQFNNAAWVLDGDGAGQSVTANYATSPDGYQNADRIQLNKTGGTYSRIRQLFTAAYSGATTFSVYLKTNDATTKTAYLRIDGGTSTLITITGNWTRFSITNNWIYSLGYAAELFLDTGSSNTADISAYGAQVEAGAYATSYIPTLGAAVTRGADAASKTGISSLIGQTEGTLFIETTYNGAANTGQFNRLINITDGTTTNFISLAKNNTTAELYIYSETSAGVQVNSTPIANTNIIGTHKIALAYKANDFVLYVDGVQRFTDTSAAVAVCNTLNIGTLIGGDELGGSVNQALLFKTRLTNAQLAELTTI